MTRRILAICLSAILLAVFPATGFACDDEQSKNHISQILFGANAGSYQSKDSVSALMDAVYLCCEQEGNQGTERINDLKKTLRSVPDLKDIKITSEDELYKDYHSSWGSVGGTISNLQQKRRDILLDTVNKVFDFGLRERLFSKRSGKCNSLAALIYYCHILSDYMGSNENRGEAVVRGSIVSGFSGSPYCEVNGNKPSFTEKQKANIDSFVNFSGFDSSGRTGVAFAMLGPETLPPPDSRQNIGVIKPSGWNQNKYQGITDETNEPPYLYNRCHLIGHQLLGNDSAVNLITGTRYLNISGMEPLENKVAEYIRDTESHVLYRATPIYSGNNLLASGVQLEAYSVEDHGKGISFNVFCYNVQPGIELNYENGKNSESDLTVKGEKMIPFVISQPNDTKPDLIFELKKHLTVLFKDNETQRTYDQMISKLNTIAGEAGVKAINAKGSSRYLSYKTYAWQVFEVLESYVPLLMEKQAFFSDASLANAA